MLRVQVPPSVCDPPDGFATTLAATDTLVPGVDPVNNVNVGEIENCTPEDSVVVPVLNVAVRPM